MAEHLASIFGTERDRVNCPFYFKVGACRHGDRCSRLHTKPSISPTLLLSNMYQRPDMITPGTDAHKMQEHLEDFYVDLFDEMSKYALKYRRGLYFAEEISEGATLLAKVFGEARRGEASASSSWSTATPHSTGCRAIFCRIAGAFWLHSRGFNVVFSGYQWRILAP